MRRENTERKKLRVQEGWRETDSRTVIGQDGGESCEICTPEGKGQQSPPFTGTTQSPRLRQMHRLKASLLVILFNPKASHAEIIFLCAFSEGKPAELCE